MNCIKCVSENPHGNTCCSSCGVRLFGVVAQERKRHGSGITENPIRIQFSLSIFLRVGLTIAILGLGIIFGAMLYLLQRVYVDHGYPDDSTEWATYIGIWIFLLGIVYLLAALLLRMRTNQLIAGLSVSLPGLFIIFGTTLHDYIEYGYSGTGNEWAMLIGTCLFLLGAVVLLITGLVRAGTDKLMSALAIPLLGLLIFFGAALYNLQSVLSEYGYYVLSVETWALYIGLWVFMIGGAYLLAMALLRETRLRLEDKKCDGF